MRSGSGCSRCYRSRSATQGNSTVAKLGVGASHWITGGFLKGSSMDCGRESNGRLCRKNGSAVPVPFTPISSDGRRPEYSLLSGKPDWRNTKKWRESPGSGKALTAPWAKHHWRERLSAPTRRIGGKKGSKRHLLVDGHGVPLSLVVTGANRHDGTQLEAVLDALVIERPEVTVEEPQHLCADNGYAGEPARQARVDRNDTAQVRPRAAEARATKTIPGFRARRWIVEAGHSWFNRLRKIDPRDEKTRASHEALHHLAAAIISWRKIGVIYG